MQIQNDRQFVPFLESFCYENRKHLYDTLKSNKMENVIFLSGDVHLGHLYESECASFTGQRVLPEITSSGLSHTLDVTVPYAGQLFNLLSREDAQVSEIYYSMNYGNVEVASSSD